MTAAAARKLRIFWFIGGGGGSAARLTPLGVGVGTPKAQIGVWIVERVSAFIFSVGQWISVLVLVVRARASLCFVCKGCEHLSGCFRDAADTLMMTSCNKLQVLIKGKYMRSVKHYVISRRRSKCMKVRQFLVAGCCHGLAANRNDTYIYSEIERELVFGSSAAFQTNIVLSAFNAHIVPKKAHTIIVCNFRFTGLNLPR